MLRVGRVACRVTGLLFDRLPFFQKVRGPAKEWTKEKGRGEWKEREKTGYRGGPGGGGGRGECERVCAGMGIGGGSESGSEESAGRGHRKTGCQSARTLDIGEHTSGEKAKKTGTPVFSKPIRRSIFIDSCCRPP